MSLKLLTLDDNYQVELNKEWLYLIPEFHALIKRDKGSEGDYRGTRKLQARREFTFIYFELDFSSPYSDWESFARRQEAMRCADLKESHLDAAVMAAYNHYDKMVLAAARSLRTLRAMKKGLDAMDNRFENADFDAVDKKGEKLYTVKQFQDEVKGVGPTYKMIEDFEKRVTDELKNNGSSIRGTAQLGRREAALAAPVTEGVAPEGIKQTNWRDLQLALGNPEDEDDDDDIDN